MEVLKVSGLRKTYKTVTALKNLDFTVNKGEVLGLLGPNGSGKTTTLGILLGVIKQDSGSFSWFQNGMADENRKRIGALLETPNFFPYLNAVDNLKIVAKIKGMENPLKRIDEVLEIVDLSERKTHKFSGYSLGMKQRLAIASALLSKPEILVLDEPTNGLDPKGIAEIRTLIQNVAKEGITIIIASHILDEIEKICSHVLILNKGSLITEGTLAEILTQDLMLLLKAEDMVKLKSVITSSNGITIIKETDDSVLVKIDGKSSSAEINKMFMENGIYLSEIKQHQKNLETTFLEILDK